MFLIFLLSLIHDEEGSLFFRNLYEKYKDKMYYAAWKVLKDSSNAEDVMQDTFFIIASQEKILKRLMELNMKSEVYVSNYVTKMCRNEALRKMGKAAYQREQLSGLERAVSSEEPNVEAQESGNPEDLLCRNAELDLVTKALKDLSPEDEILIQLFYFQEFSMDEIAAQLNITKNTLYVRHHRVLKTLARILKKEA